MIINKTYRIANGFFQIISQPDTKSSITTVNSPQSIIIKSNIPLGANTVSLFSCSLCFHLCFYTTRLDYRYFTG